MQRDAKIYIAGHDGLVGSAISRNLESKGFTNIVTRRFAELDLTRQNEVEAFFDEVKPELVIDSAAKVGGILSNQTYRAQFIYENLMIQNNIIHASHSNNVKKLLFLGSSCIYPKHAQQPMKEEYLLTGLLEPTNEAYAIAKIAGIKMCENYYAQYKDNFISVMPTNLYGSNDNFNLKTSHVLPALIKKFHIAKIAGKKQVEIWGSGNPLREFLHVDDMADACVYILENIDAENLYEEQKVSHINIGTGDDISIKNLAILIGKVVGYRGELVFDKSKPDGTYKKQLDVTRLHNMGWFHKISLSEGIKTTYDWFLENLEENV
jgi:GDP-L-fucose synthase